MPDQLRTLAYTSQANQPLDTKAFMVLLASAQRFNATVKVTGLLVLASRQKFIQTLEGTEDGVSAVYDRIARDASHSHVVVFVDESIAVRVYPDWAMMGNSEQAAPALIKFLYYALQNKSSLFTPGQIAALNMTLQHMLVE
jgi:hypothetical protein